MGKETIKRPLTILRKRNRYTDANTQLSVFSRWAQPPSMHETRENGRVIVILRKHEQDTSLICKGYQKEGNSVADLLAKLAEKSFINKNVTVYNVLMLKQYMWTAIDMRKDTFSANDYLLIILGDKVPRNYNKGVRKVIRKQHCHI